MNNNFLEIYGTASWYKELANYTFPTSFVRLKDGEINALAAGEHEGAAAEEVQRKLKHPMSSFPGNCFVFTDFVAPTDTERFEGKRGAVYSPGSAWRYLVESSKVRQAAENGQVKHICVRPFRRITKPREFRLFIKDGKLQAMSQYWLIRHYRRLVGRKDLYWELACDLINKISWLLPEPDIVIDIYFTASNKILIIDFNPWGEPTNPLIFRSWDSNWSENSGLKIIEPPVTVGGDVNVSF